ncbi:MAG: GLUG motif-containing protein, partial [Bacteroidota bacterium]|nr:GLUG motif-containing protein [Bacteroidota bacterium]
MERTKRKELIHQLMTLLVINILGFTMVIPVFTKQEPVSAEDTGWKLATSYGEDYTQWGDPSYLLTDDGNDAWGRTSDKINEDYYDFSLDVPSGATILGIEVKLGDTYGFREDSAGLDVKLSGDGGSTETSAYSHTFVSVETYIYGGTSDLWGTTWDSGEFTNGNFRVHLIATTTNIVFADYIQVNVTYELPDNLPPQISTPNPYDNQQNIPVSLSELSIYIYDSEGDGFNWTIETQPNIGSKHNWTSEDTNNTYTCSISGLSDATTYTWWVNATDNASDNTSSNWTSREYSFTTTTAYCDLQTNSLSDEYSTSSVTITASELGGLTSDSADLYYRYSKESYQDIFAENNHAITIQTPGVYKDFDWGFYAEEWDYEVADSAMLGEESDVLVDDGILFVRTQRSGTNGEAKLYALWSGNGTAIWTKSLPHEGYAGLNSDSEHLYLPMTNGSVTNCDGGIICIYKSNGSTKWDIDVEGGVTMGISVDEANGLIYYHPSRGVNEDMTAIYMNNGSHSHNISASITYSACQDLLMTRGDHQYYIFAPDGTSAERIKCYRNPELPTGVELWSKTIDECWDSKLFSGYDSNTFFIQYDGMLQCRWVTNGTAKWSVSNNQLTADCQASYDDGVIYTVGEGENKIINMYAYYAKNGTLKWNKNVTSYLDGTIWDTEDEPFMTSGTSYIFVHISMVSIGRDSVIVNINHLNRHGIIMTFNKTDGKIEVIHEVPGNTTAQVTLHGGNAYFITSEEINGNDEGRVHSLSIGNGSYSDWSKYQADSNNTGSQTSDWTDHHYVNVSWSRIDADENRMILTNHYPFTVEDITIQHRNGAGNLVVTDWYNYSDSALYYEDSSSFTVGLEPYQVLDLRLKNNSASGTASYSKPSKTASYGWTKFGTDSSSPWSWDFNNPRGYGYYEFYVRGFDSTGNEARKDVPEERYQYIEYVRTNLTLQSGSFSFVGGGRTNRSLQKGSFSFTSAGSNQTLQTGSFSFTSKGTNLTLQQGSFSFVGGGRTNQTLQSGSFSFLGGGRSNQTLQSGSFSFIGGGRTNQTLQSGSFSFTAEVVYTNGDGTTGNPYQITNIEQLYHIKDFLDKHFILMNNLDFQQDSSYSDTGNKPGNISGSGWDSIGESSNYFSGSFNGQNYTINNLFIERETTHYIGLFGYTTTGANIKNTQLTNINISGNQNVGGLCGKTYGTDIDNCHATGESNGSGYVGGLIGHAGIDSSITNSSFSGDVSSSGSYSGGLIGYGYTVSIYGSFSSGTVVGHNYAAGLSGLAMYTSLVEECYSSSDVSGDDYVGGLVGWIDAMDEVDNSFSCGAVSGNSYVGGLIGRNNGGTVTNSFYDTDTSGQSDTGKGTPTSTGGMKNKYTFSNAGWDITYTTIDSNNGYPYLAWQNDTNTNIWLILTKSNQTLQSGSFSFTVKDRSNQTIQQGSFSFIGGGRTNQTLQSGSFSFIGGGRTNQSLQSGSFSFTSGGRTNQTLQQGSFSFNSAGSNQSLQSGSFSFTAESRSNQSLQSGSFSFTSTGSNQSLQSGSFSFTAESRSNQSLQSGSFSFTSTGSNQSLQSGSFSFNCGGRSNQTLQSGSFSFTSTGSNQSLQSGSFSFNCGGRSNQTLQSGSFSFT